MLLNCINICISIQSSITDEIIHIYYIFAVRYRISSSYCLHIDAYMCVFIFIYIYIYIYIDGVYNGVYTRLKHEDLISMLVYMQVNTCYYQLPTYIYIGKHIYI